MFGSARRLRSVNSAYPSADHHEHLSDVHLANVHAADEKPAGSTSVRYNYPRAAWQVPDMFAGRKAQRVLLEQKALLVQQYCHNLHWYNLVLIGPERRAYYWEPYGSPLAGRSAICEAFYKAAPSGWTLDSIRVQLQPTSDLHSCGDWAHYFRCCVLAYAASEHLGRGLSHKHLDLGSGAFTDILCAATASAI